MRGAEGSRTANLLASVQNTAKVNTDNQTPLNATARNGFGLFRVGAFVIITASDKNGDTYCLVATITNAAEEHRSAGWLKINTGHVTPTATPSI